MAAPLSPGDWVECINPHATLIRHGGVYCVAEVFGCQGPCECGSTIGVDLIGAVSDPISCWCAGCEVRPIYRPNADFIESLKAPPKSAPSQPTLPTRTPEVVGAWSRDEQNTPVNPSLKEV